MNRTLRDLSAAPTPALPHGEGVYRWQIGEWLPNWYSSLVRYNNHNTDYRHSVPSPVGES